VVAGLGEGSTASWGWAGACEGWAVSLLVGAGSWEGWAASWDWAADGK
ncbi:hypothetical protein Tco_0915206, partial [Tanacetum coccineum]